MRGLLIIFVSIVVSQTASAGVQSLGKPVDMTTAKGQKYVKVDITCDNSDLRPAIIKRSGAIQWCSFTDSSLCAKSKMTVALKTCQSRHLAKLRKSQGGSENKAESKKAVAVKKSALDIEREKIEIEKQRVELEKQKVILQQLEAELQKLEFELERDSKAN